MTIFQKTILYMATTCMLMVSHAMSDDVEMTPFDRVIKAEQQRIEFIARHTPSVVCVYDSNKRGGGSGVIISPEGYGLTNFHVVAGMMASRKGWGGLSDGVLYEIEILGIDPTGDVAMFRMKGKDSFAYSKLGDSDTVEIGDSVIAMGNPFVISEDYTPSVTTGIVTGTHRYQWGVGNNLIYSDCIQVDAAINPGNSGGPLFNTQGEVIGINGRISVNTRGRFNVGFGYAISSNQIKRFIPALRAGLLARHGTLDAMVEDMEGVGVVFSKLIPNGIAERIGIIHGDKLLSIDNHLIRSRNHFASLMGTYSADWPITIKIERSEKEIILFARLNPFQPKLRIPFEVNRDVNLREIKRVVQSSVKAVLKQHVDGANQKWRWQIQRRYILTENEQPKPQEKYLVTRNPIGPVTMKRQYEDGSFGATIQYDNHSVTQKIIADGETFDLPEDISMIYKALYIMHHHLLLLPDRLDLVEVKHEGADTLLSRDIDLFNQPEDHSPSIILEVLSWPMGDDVKSKFSFDMNTGELRKISVLDRPTGQEVTLLMSQYRDLGGVHWPESIIVRTENETYVDTLSHWEVIP